LQAAQHPGGLSFGSGWCNSIGGKNLDLTFLSNKKLDQFYYEIEERNLATVVSGYDGCN